MTSKTEKRTSRWWFGGVSASMAACVTHPLDLIKVHLQTQQESSSIIQLTKNLIHKNGFFSLYNGVSASVFRQITYSTARFGFYEVGKTKMSSDTFLQKILIAGLGGLIGGFVGTPGDMINVRMQNDIKLPPEKRRNYKHALNGLSRVYKEEGAKQLLSGATMATTRGCIVTAAQLAVYDEVKIKLLKDFKCDDNITTHFLSSVVAGAVATIISQPVDVLKTRLMNSAAGEFNGVIDVIMFTAKMGPLGFFKGTIPSFVRVGPHTICTFLFLEQLRLNFGVLVVTD